MKYYISIVSFVLLFSLSLILPAKEIRGKVISISDGDTFWILCDSTKKRIKIRMDGIDCPEQGQPYYNRSSLFTDSLINGKNVLIHWEKKDQFKRVLGTVFLGDINVNEILLMEGMAWHYRFNNDKRLADLQKHAQIRKINIWSDLKPIEPYIFRKMKKAKEKKAKR